MDNSSHTPGLMLIEAAITTVIQVSRSRMNVRFDSENPYILEDTVHLPPVGHSTMVARTDADNMIAYAAHEAAHKAWTIYPPQPWIMTRLDALPMPPPFTTSSRADLYQAIWNIIEDLHIEQILIAAFPGVAGPLDHLRAAMTERMAANTASPGDVGQTIYNSILALANTEGRWSNSQLAEKTWRRIAAALPGLEGVLERNRSAISPDPSNPHRDRNPTALALLRDILELMTPPAQKPPEPQDEPETKPEPGPQDRTPETAYPAKQDSTPGPDQNETPAEKPPSQENAQPKANAPDEEPQDAATAPQGSDQDEEAVPESGPDAANGTENRGNPKHTDTKDEHRSAAVQPANGEQHDAEGESAECQAESQSDASGETHDRAPEPSADQDETPALAPGTCDMSSVTVPPNPVTQAAEISARNIVGATPKEEREAAKGSASLITGIISETIVLRCDDSSYAAKMTGMRARLSVIPSPDHAPIQYSGLTRHLRSQVKEQIRRRTRSGRLDTRNCLEIATGSPNIYRSTRTPTRTSAAITLLVDCSSSTEKNNVLGIALDASRKIAALSALSTDICTAIVGYTAIATTAGGRDEPQSISTLLYTLKTHGQHHSIAERSIQNMSAGCLTGGTPTGTAILRILPALAGRQENLKLLIVLTDGEASDHLVAKEALRAARLLDIQTAVIEIRSGGSQHMPYASSFTAKSAEEIPEKLELAVLAALSKRAHGGASPSLP